MSAHPATAHAQAMGARPSVSPAVPSSAVGAITNSATVSVMGVAALASTEESTTPAQQQLFMGVTQPIGRLGGVKLTAIGMGFLRVRDAVNANSSAEGALAIRATGRLNGMRTWGALAYGRANAMGGVSGSSFAPTPGNVGLDGGRVDTTISRRVDIGSVARVESGILGSSHGFDLSLGLSVERATRVTTQTLSIQAIDNFPVSPSSNGQPTAITRTLRALQRREVATGLASVGWQTGGTSWLGSVSAPLYAWITRDAASPTPRLAPVVASLAVVQPVTAWLSAVGSASTNASSVGSSALGDNVSANRRAINPVFALGVSIKRVPFRPRGVDNNLSGILGFESRVVERLTSVVLTSDSMLNETGDSTYKVRLTIDAPTAGYVELMGDATAWNITNMNRGNDGRWQVELKLGAGAHRFAVRADGGDWIAPPGLPLGSNEFGGSVGLLVLEPQRAKR
ncbi:MAG: hypothetical protein H7Z40_15335 [Phycisphaerae bacterium]|nr:hypothetical protein [Gemmatimonadaceae bacterium]